MSPGETPTTASTRLMPEAYFNSIDPSGSSVACADVVRVESKPRTLHQVTVYWSLAELTKTPPPALGSRSARNNATRGGPVSRRPTLRSVLALSPSRNVTLPSELTKAVRSFPE